MEVIKNLIEVNLNNPDIILGGMFLALAGISNAMLDRLADPVAFDTSIFSKWRRSFWLKTESWGNKWKRYPTGDFYFTEYNEKNQPKRIPKFWGSSTVFVFLTDGWHLVQFFQWTFVALACACLVGAQGWLFWFAVLSFKAVLSSFFELFYKSVFRRGGNRR